MIAALRGTIKLVGFKYVMPVVRVKGICRPNARRNLTYKEICVLECFSELLYEYNSLEIDLIIKNCHVWEMQKSKLVARKKNANVS